MRAVLVLSLCFALAACASVEPVPNARPLSQANLAALGATRASLNGSQTGVAKSWFYTDVNGGGAGLIGALAGVIAAAIINVGPSRRATRQATEIAEAVTPEMLDQSLAAQFKAIAGTAKDGPVTFSDVVTTQKIVVPGELDDTLEVATSYTLSEDSSVLRVVSTATYTNAAIPYKTPYTFKKQAPASESKGPLYRNVFTYYSKPFPVPVLTPELKARLAASVREAMRNEAGALPAEGTSEYKSMMHDVELAQDDKLTVTESSVFLTREWLKNRTEPLKQEIEKAHGFIAKYVSLDINRTAIPSLEGTDELLETLADDRTVRRIGAGPQAGSYVSSAANVAAPATYGNTIAIGKPTAAYLDGLRKQAKKGK